MLDGSELDSLDFLKLTNINCILTEEQRNDIRKKISWLDLPISDPMIFNYLILMCETCYGQGFMSGINYILTNYDGYKD